MKTIRMKKDDWQKWDTALRSGEYLQGEKYLKTGNSYCCLGVLQHCLTGEVEMQSEYVAEGLPTLEWLDGHDIQFFNKEAYGGEDHGDDSLSPYLPALDQTADEANDGTFVIAPRKFIQIADAIAEAVEFTDA